MVEKFGILLLFAALALMGLAVIVGSFLNRKGPQ